MSRARITILSLAAAAVAACAAGDAQTPAPAGEPVISPAAIEAHVRFLADDLMEGREAGTRGYDLAASYVATQFRLMGLAPGGDGGSYLQTVPLQGRWLVPEEVAMEVRGADGAVRALRLGEDFITNPSAREERTTVSAPAVFAGYGVVAPEFGHDDYAALDVDGRIVVVLSGAPAGLPSEEAAHYGSAREKNRAAEARGAVGMITVYTDASEPVTPWARVSRTTGEMSMTWIGPDGTPFSSAPGIRVAALMSPTAGAVLFDGADRSYAEVRAAVADGPPAGFPLAVSVTLTLGSRHEVRPSANVVGIVEGSDPALRDEYVVMMAHLDHNGVGPAVDGDTIYNGALDNASGVAILLEAARAVAALPVAPRRSVVFLATTAEEKGLLGSEYFAQNPTVPGEAMVAAVDVDMPVLLYDFTDLIAFGAEHSSLADVLEETLARVDLDLTPDPMPEQGIFTRSDHYRFVQQGVPAVLLATGWNTPDGAGEGGRVFENFLSTNYHRPADDLDQPIDFAVGARFARVNYLLMEALANADTPPTWNEGDFFGELFGRGR